MTPLIAVIIETILKSSVILGLTGLASLALRRQSAALRHTVWTVGLFCSLTLPLFSLAMPTWRVEPIRALPVFANVIAPQPVVVLSTPTVDSQPAPVPAPLRRITPDRILLTMWLLGSVVIASLLLRELIRLARVAIGSSTVRQTLWIELAREISYALRLSRQVRLIRNPNASVLGTWGTLRPRVLLPRESVSWSTELMRSVLGHELAHVKRNDWLVQVIAEIARAIYWFNPLFWIACTQLRHESEQACDDTAIRLGEQLGIDGPTYASHVLDLARTQKHEGQTVAALAMAGTSNLERRLVAMLNPSLNRRITGKGMTVLICLLALGLTLPLAAMRSQTAIPITTDSGVRTADKVDIDFAQNLMKASGNVTAESRPKIAATSATLFPSPTPTAPVGGAKETEPETTLQNAGTLSVSVRDQSGGVMFGARVDLTAQSNGAIRRTLSNESGVISFTQLPLDTYSGTVDVVDFRQAKFAYTLTESSSTVHLIVTMSPALTTVTTISASLPPGLQCFSIFGGIQADGTPFTDADCPDGRLLIGAAPPSPPAAAIPGPVQTEVRIGPAPAAPAINPSNGRPYPIRVGGDIQAGNLLFHPNPAYPSEARSKGIEGLVVLSAVISKDGSLQELKIISSSNPLLETTALETIQKWRYRPTLLNKEPIDIPTTISLIFTLFRPK